MPKFWFTTERQRPSFERVFDLFHHLPVTPHTSRKHFFAKLLGLVAVVGVPAQLVAVSAAEVAESKTGRRVKVRGLEVRSDLRAVARRGDSQ